MRRENNLLMKIRTYVILGLLAFVVGLVAFAPASLIESTANRAMAPNATLSISGGTVWSGSGTVALFSSRSASLSQSARPITNAIAIPISWRFDPLALLRLRLGFYIKAESPLIAGNTRIGAGLQTIQLSDTALRIDGALLGQINPLISIAGPSGQFQITIADGNRVTAPYPRPQELPFVEGKLNAQVEALAVRMVSPRPLGNFEVAIKLNGANAEYAFTNASGALKFDGGGAVAWGNNGGSTGSSKSGGSNSPRTFTYRGIASASTSNASESAQLLAPLLAVGKATTDGRVSLDINTNW